MDLLVYLIAAFGPFAVAVRGVGHRGMWIGLALVSIILSAGLHLQRVDATPVTKELEQLTAQNPANGQSPQLPDPACKEAPGKRCDTISGERTGDSEVVPARSAWPLGLSLSASLGFLLAGIFSRRQKEEPAAPPRPASPILAAAAAAPAPSPTNGLTIAQRSIGGVTILDLGGRLVLGHGTDTLRKAVLQLLAGNARHLLINMEGLSKADSAGIGVLVEVLIQTTKEGGKLKLLRVPRIIHNVLAVHRLLPVFEMWDDEEKAVASFQ